MMCNTAVRVLSRRMFCVAAGLVLCLLALELALFAGGQWCLWRTTRNMSAGIPDGAYRVLCVGDSVTYGMGAGRGESYPEWLGKILSERYSGRPVRVINAGAVGHNASMVRKLLESAMTRLKPDLVIFLAGTSGAWNYSGYEEFRKSGGPGRFRRMLGRSRVFNLGVLLWRAVSNRYFTLGDVVTKRAMLSTDGAYLGVNKRSSFGHPALDRANALKIAGDYDGARSIIADFLDSSDASASDRAVAMSLMGIICLENGRLGQAKDWFIKGIAQDSSLTYNYCGIGLCRVAEGDRDGALNWFVEAMCLSRGDFFVIPLFYDLICSSGRFDEVIGKLRKMSEPTTEVSNLLALLSRKEGMHEEIAAWVADDVGRACALCAASGVPMIILSYPCPCDAWVSAVLRGEAERRGGAFVDLERLFGARPDFGELIAGDGAHLKSEGYRAMAGYIADVISSGGFIDGDGGEGGRS